MKVKKIVAEVFNKDGTHRTTIETEEIILDALCAHRDMLLQSEDWESVEVQSKLYIIQEQIVDLLRQMTSK